MGLPRTVQAGGSRSQRETAVEKTFREIDYLYRIAILPLALAPIAFANRVGNRKIGGKSRRVPAPRGLSRSAETGKDRLRCRYERPSFHN